MRIVDYHVLVYGEPSALKEAVQAAIAQGWIPFGGVSMTSSGASGMGWWFAQALVRYGK